MTFTAKDVMQSAATTLLDLDFVRWPLTEMLGYLNEGLREIVALKPNANTKAVTLTLVPGTLQTLPAEYTILSRVTRNLITGHTEPGGPVGSTAIRPIKDRAILDAMFPNWQADASLFSAKVKHVIYDLADPRIFYVAPGNTGAGKVEAVVGAYVAEVPAPGDASMIDNFTATVGLPDLYRNALVNWVCYRAFSKDSGLPASAERAAAHLGLFQSQIGALGQGETALALPATVPVG